MLSLESMTLKAKSEPLCTHKIIVVLFMQPWSVI